MFLASQTQWRVGLAGRSGLDYAGVQAVMTMYGIDDTRDAFQRIQIMERELMSIDRNKADTHGA